MAGQLVIYAKVAFLCPFNALLTCASSVAALGGLPLSLILPPWKIMKFLGLSSLQLTSSPSLPPHVRNEGT